MFTTVLNINKQVAEKGSGGYFSFDSDTLFIICNNSANVSIYNNKAMFVGNIQAVENHSFATIGGKGHSASGIDTVQWK